MGVLNWILNSMESNISKPFAIAKHQELWNLIANSYAWKNNHARIYQVTRELAQLRHGGMSSGDYYALSSGYMERT